MIGVPIARITGGAEPTARDMLRLVLYKIKTLNKNLRDSLADSVTDVRVFMEKLKLNVVRDDKLLDIVTKDYRGWQKCLRNKNANTSAQIQARNTFEARLDNKLGIVSDNHEIRRTKRKQPNTNPPQLHNTSDIEQKRLAKTKAENKLGLTKRQHIESDYEETGTNNNFPNLAITTIQC